MPRESGKDPTFDDGDIIVLSQENVPGQTSSPRHVSTALARSALVCIHVSQGQGTLSKDVV